MGAAWSRQVTEPTERTQMSVTLTFNSEELGDVGKLFFKKHRVETKVKRQGLFRKRLLSSTFDTSILWGLQIT